MKNEELIELKIKNAKLLVAEVLKINPILFCDQFNEPFIATSGDGSQVFRIDSKNTKLWLIRTAWENLDETYGSETIKTACDILESKAKFEGQKVKLSVRTAWNDEHLWYDLGDGDAVQINKDGWQVIKNTPIIFRRFQHQKFQSIPAFEGSIEKIFDYVNISSEEEKLLFLVFLVTSFIPNFPHPILVLHGLQGSAKSTTSKLIKTLVDPSDLATISPPKDLEQFVQTASHHWLIAFDNLSCMPDWLSDALCRLCSGEGFSKRGLYTNDDDFIYSYQHIAIINGVNQVVTKPDLLDRLIIIELDRIAPERRLTELELLKNFELAKPQILGGIFDIVSKTLSEYSSVNLTRWPRMADFARWGCAVTRAMGYTEKEFFAAYNKNIQGQHDEAISASPVASCIQTFMKNRSEWSGQPSELFNELTNVAITLQIDKKYLPRDPARLGKKIKEMQVNLQGIGIEFESGKSGERFYRLTNTNLSDKTVHNAHNVRTSEKENRITDSMDSTDGKKFNPNEKIFGDTSFGDIDNLFGIASIPEEPNHEKS